MAAAGRLARAAALLLLVPAGAHGAGEVRTDGGRVLIARGSPVMLEDHGKIALVALAPAASLTGLSHLRELQPGDRVTYRWRTATAGVHLAESLSVEPVIGNEAPFTYTEGELAVALQQQRPPLLIDARPGPAFRGGHLPGARSLPADAAASAVSAAVPRDREATLVVYGESKRDPAAHHVARRLLAAGARSVKILDGGIGGWIDADHPLALRAADISPRMRAEPWVIVDVRPRERLQAGTPAGAVSIPLDAFRWQDFDGALPLPPLIVVGADAGDPAPLEFTERVAKLRSTRSVKTTLRLHVLAGGFEAWRGAGLPVERGGAVRQEVPFVPLSRSEISPQEFGRLWADRGGSRTTFLDVRRVGTSPEEWVVKIPLEDLPARIGELPKDREIVAYCAVGERSHVAAEILRANGFHARFLRAQPGR